MNKEVLDLFNSIRKQGNCAKLAADLSRKISETGGQAKVRRIFHRDNLWGDSHLYCEHICGESFTQHFVVECEGQILDPRLSSPISLSDYLRGTYRNSSDLMMS